MITFDKKVVAFCDEGRHDWDNIFHPRFLRKEIKLTNVTVYSTSKAFLQSFDVFMFDWGGMSLGNDMMEHFIRRLYKSADNHPNKDYVLLSRMTQEAYSDFLGYGDLVSLSNILTFNEFTNQLRIEHDRNQSPSI